MNCKKCGCEIKEGNLFCTNCGHKIGESLDNFSKISLTKVIIFFSIMLLIIIYIGMTKMADKRRDYNISSTSTENTSTENTSTENTSAENTSAENTSTENISKEDLEKVLADDYVGIGIYMQKNTNYNKVEIISVIKDSPAEKAGIKAGDIILKVDEIEYNADELDNISNKIKGPEGTTLTMEILRDTLTLNFEITRKKINPNPLEKKVLSENIGYIKFSEFNKTIAKEFKNAYEDLNKQGIKSLIIDLRNNAGGYVDQSIEIASYIVDKGSIISYEVDENKNEKAIKSDKSPFINLPIIILTNGGTASAAEILTGALQDLGKAKVVGEKTYGKAVIQSIVRLEDGSGKIINVGEFLTPNKKRVQDTGIEPNEIVILQDTASEDTQLQSAIELLHK